MKKNNKFNILFAIIVFFVIGGGAYYYLDFNKSRSPEPTQTPDLAAGGVENKKMADEYSGQILGGNTSLLFDFYMGDYEKALKTDKLIVLYFYANWCPICRAEFPKMTEVFNELEGDEVIGFRVNYNDNETDNDEKELARQFGVAYQHTKVFVRNGQRIGKYTDSWDKNKYLQEINKVVK